MFAPIPNLSFEGHKVAWKILERGLGFLLLTKNIIPLKASSASPDLKLCVQRSTIQASLQFVIYWEGV